MSSAAARLNSLSKHLGDLDRTLVKTAGGVVSDALADRVARDTGGDSRLSGFGKRAKNLAVDVKPLGEAGVRLSPKRGQAGQWAILNTGAKPHDVVARGLKGGRRTARGGGRVGRVKPLYLGGNRFALRVHNVRSPAKHTWDRARDQSIPKAVEAVRREFHKAVNDG
jgi:hypothetical protein